MVVIVSTSNILMWLFFLFFFLFFFSILFCLLHYFIQVCDQPHPLYVKNIIRNILEGKFDDACSGLKQLYDLGYSPTDIITTLFRIIKNYDMAEYLKLEFMKVFPNATESHWHSMSSIIMVQVEATCHSMWWQIMLC